MKLTGIFDVCPAVLFGFPFYYLHNMLKAIITKNSVKKAIIYIYIYDSFDIIVLL